MTADHGFLGISLAPVGQALPIGGFAGAFDDPLHDAFGDHGGALHGRLIGGDRALVLHGGGNTSVKATSTDRFGDDHDGVFVKASGFDLATMGVEGFTGMKREAVTRLAELEPLIAETDESLLPVPVSVLGRGGETLENFLESVNRDEALMAEFSSALQVKSTIWFP